MPPALRRRPPRRYLGLHRGLVVDTDDPQQGHRVQVTFPWLPRARATWAATLRDVAGPPEIGDEVLLGFDDGHLARPYVVGVLARPGPQVVGLADENGNSVRLSTSGVEITAAADLRINAATLRVVAAAGRVDSGMCTFSGVVQSQTLITDTVIASTYTPGAGNLM